MHEQYKALLLHINEALAPHRISWVIYGAGSLALRGFDFAVHDIDILTDGVGFGVIVDVFKSQGVKIERCAQRQRGIFVIDGITVECKASDSHSALIQDPDWLEVGAGTLPVISLQNLLKAYYRCNREKDQPKIRAIEATLAVRGE